MEDVTDTRFSIDDTAVVETTNGPVRGAGDGVVTHWLGVRYAAAPVGTLRWRSPRSPQPWTEPADATRVGPVCPQPTNPRIPLDLGAPQGADCLTVNVWSPAHGDGPRPVLVWVHGGAYILGSGAQPLYNGRELAAGGDVVVVTVNYRLGPFGFLDLSWLGEGFETNIGLRDVLFALRWVRDNIANFGGDPDRVTLFGESAGGGVVTTLLASPAAEGLFHRAIAQSSPVTSVYDQKRAQRIGEQFLGELGMTARQSDQLSELPVTAIIAAAKELFNDVPRLAPGTLGFAPIVDGDIVPDYPVNVARSGRSLPVPLIIGTNEHEAALFRWMRSPLLPISGQAISEMFTAIASEQPDLQIPTPAQIAAVYRGRGKKPGLGVARDIGFRMPSIWFAEGHSVVAPVYMYRFDWSTPMLRVLGLGGAHATELPYVWGNLVAGRRDPTFKLGGLAAGTEVSRRMRQRWCNFARGGAPDADDGPRWRPYDEQDRVNLLIGRDDQLAFDPDHIQRSTWGTEVLSFR